MSESWDQTVRLLTSEETDISMEPPATWNRGDEAWRYVRGKALEEKRRCRLGRRCTEAATHMIGWTFSGGRTGRVKSTERRACTTHARGFAERYGVAFPEAA